MIFDRGVARAGRVVRLPEQPSRSIVTNMQLEETCDLYCIPLRQSEERRCEPKQLHHKVLWALSNNVKIFYKTLFWQ